MIFYGHNLLEAHQSAVITYTRGCMTAARHQLIVVKIGTNVITRDDGLLDRPVLQRIVAQVCGLKQRRIDVILVSSGAMAAGRALLTPSASAGSVVKRQMLAAVGQASLMGEYLEAFRAHRYLCAQVLTTKEDFRTRQHYLNMRACFSALLKDDVVPIVNENDVISVEELMFTDNDELAGLIPSWVSAPALVIMPSVDGVLGEPSGSGGAVIPVIEPGSSLWKKYVQPSTSQFGKGGMHTKCSVAEKLAATGIAVHIVNGRSGDALMDVVEGKNVGTFFRPAGRTSTVKRWIAHAHGMEKGTLVVNRCAADILRSAKPVSLLPVGVVRVEGDFEKGDIVLICGENGEKLGLGKAQYGAQRARSVMGQKGQKPLVHYDYLYIA